MPERFFRHPGGAVTVKRHSKTAQQNGTVPLRGLGAKPSEQTPPWLEGKTRRRIPAGWEVVARKRAYAEKIGTGNPAPRLQPMRMGFPEPNKTNRLPAGAR